MAGKAEGQRVDMKLVTKKYQNSMDDMTMALASSGRWTKAKVRVQNKTKQKTDDAQPQHVLLALCPLSPTRSHLHLSPQQGAALALACGIAGVNQRFFLYFIWSTGERLPGHMDLEKTRRTPSFQV